MVIISMSTARVVKVKGADQSQIIVARSVIIKGAAHEHVLIPLIVSHQSHIVATKLNQHSKIDEK